MLFELFEETLTCGSHFAFALFGGFFVIHPPLGFGDNLLLLDQSPKLFESLLDGVSLFQVYGYQTPHLLLEFFLRRSIIPKMVGKSATKTTKWKG